MKKDESGETAGSGPVPAGHDKAISEEEYLGMMRRYKDGCSASPDGGHEKGIKGQKEGKRRGSFRLISGRDLFLLGVMGLTALGTYVNHGRINDVTGCYFRELTGNVCIVEKKPDQTRGDRTYEVRTGDDLVQVVYNSNTNTVSVPQPYVDRELEGNDIDVSQAMSSLYQNNENRHEAVSFVVQNLTDDELRENGRGLAEMLYKADKQTVQDIVLDDLANNPVENRDALVGVSQEGARRYPAEVAPALSNEDMLNETKRRGSDTLNMLYNEFMSTIRDNYNLLFGEDGNAAPNAEGRGD